MATLTWQDVAGQVRPADFTDASAMITKGVESLGTAVKDIVGGPEQRRKAQLAKELMLGQMQMQGMQEHADQGAQLGKDLGIRTEKKDAKEFGAAQSTLEALARNTALKGGTYEDVLKSDAYLKLGEGARAYGASNLSDAFVRGDETRMQQQQHASDVARDEAHFQANYRLSVENAAMARQDRRDAAQDRKDARELANYGKPKIWKTGHDKTDRTMTDLGRRTGNQWINASGESYAEKDLGDLGKGYANLGAVTEVFDKVNKERVSAGRDPLPINVLKRLVDTGIGSHSFVNGWNDVDDSAITQALAPLGEQYDLALKGQDFYDQLSARVDAGATTEDPKKVEAAWNSMFPKKPSVRRPTSSSAQMKSDEQRMAEYMSRAHG